MGRLLSASTRHPVLEEFGRGVATTGRPDLGVDLEAVAAGSLAFCFGDRFAVLVSQLIELSLAPAGGDPGDEDGRDGTEGRVVVLALDYDKSVVALGECRIDVSSVIGCHVKGFAQTGVTGLGDALWYRSDSEWWLSHSGGGLSQCAGSAGMLVVPSNSRFDHGRRSPSIHQELRAHSSSKRGIDPPFGYPPVS